MDRRQREAELRTMLTARQGMEKLLAIYKRHAGLGESNPPPSGSLLVETILNLEYQTQGAPQQGREAAEGHESPRPGSEAREPGDVKFSEPPGSEAQGG
jgi:hypothetical protein